jgi:elongation factor P
MLTATQLRPGMVIKFNNELFSVFKMEHRTPGNLRGFVQVKMRNLRSGSQIEHRFSSEDRVEKAMLDEHEMEYLYDDGEYYYFMNTENYEQMHFTKDTLGDAVNYLVPQLKVTVEFYEGKPISVELPPSVDLTVVETEPGLKGATVSNVTKPAKLETGLVVQVPQSGRKDSRVHFRRHLPGTGLIRARKPTVARFPASEPRNLFAPTRRPIRTTAE